MALVRLNDWVSAAQKKALDKFDKSKYRTRSEYHRALLFKVLKVK